MPKLHPRFAADRLQAALAGTRVVVLAGPRQSGKTTLARALVGQGLTYLSLDDAATLAAAQADPTGLVRGLDGAIIDEVQRAPDLLPAIKDAVDRDGRPGRFVLTSSADLMTLPRVADALAGRLQTVPLLPLAQAELGGDIRPGFLARLFAGQTPITGALRIGPELVETVLAGGYPEALARASWARRHDWHLNAVEAVLQRDVRDLAQIDQPDRLPRLLRALAKHAGQLINHSSVGAGFNLNHVTTQRYTGVFEQLFLVRTLASWSGNDLNRLIKTPKLHFLDAGLLAALRNLTPDRIAQDPTPFGAVLESFVLGEVLKLTGWDTDRYTLSHFRDKSGDEVAIVLENRAGEVVGLEIKTSATVRGGDFNGLRKLRSAVGERFRFGAILYDHTETVSFGRDLAAVPLSTLWT